MNPRITPTARLMKARPFWIASNPHAVVKMYGNAAKKPYMTAKLHEMYIVTSRGRQRGFLKMGGHREAKGIAKTTNISRNED